MSRNPLPFLRPCLSRSFKPQLKAEHARVYNAIQRRFLQGAPPPIESYTGPHDVEKQKRLEQLQKAKPLGEYHPRMVHPSGVDSTLLPREFCEKYEHVKFGDEKRGHQPTVTVLGEKAQIM
jgi:lysyl-tRNA synthetase, class II